MATHFGSWCIPRFGENKTVHISSCELLREGLEHGQRRGRHPPQRLQRAQIAWRVEWLNLKCSGFFLKPELHVEFFGNNRG
jgi:hypothetical protein